MDDFDRTLAEIVFNVGDDLGLVLAGGYAISAHKLTSRPSRQHSATPDSPSPSSNSPRGWRG
ncbi:hypothetical protein ACFFRK_18750 [Amorphoplanes digitatis]